MRNLSALGVNTHDLLGPLPDLSAQAELALECWHWCDGWAPERWPSFGAFHAVRDWSALSDLQLTIRHELASHRSERA